MGTPSSYHHNSLKHRSRSFRLTACLRRRHEALTKSASDSPVIIPPTYHQRNLRVARTFSYAQLKSPDITLKCRGFITQIRDCHRGNQRRRHCASLNFRYDPLSYSLNFDNGYDSQYDGFFARNFVVSSPHPASTTAALEISIAS